MITPVLMDPCLHIALPFVKDWMSSGCPTPFDFGLRGMQSTDLARAMLVIQRPIRRYLSRRVFSS